MGKRKRPKAADDKPIEPLAALMELGRLAGQIRPRPLPGVQTNYNNLRGTGSEFQEQAAQRKGFSGWAELREAAEPFASELDRFADWHAQQLAAIDKAFDALDAKQVLNGPGQADGYR